MQKKEKLHSQLNTDQLQVLDTSSSTKRRTHQAEFIVCCSLTTMKGNRRAHSKHGKGKLKIIILLVRTGHVHDFGVGLPCAVQ